MTTHITRPVEESPMPFSVSLGNDDQHDVGAMKEVSNSMVMVMMPMPMMITIDDDDIFVVAFIRVECVA